jgi:hypothetical protein
MSEKLIVVVHKTYRNESGDTVLITEQLTHGQFIGFRTAPEKELVIGRRDRNQRNYYSKHGKVQNKANGGDLVELIDQQAWQ